MKPAQHLLLLLGGIIFGVGLAVSGMTDPARIRGFLDVAGAWDATLLFVMAGAVGTYGLGSFWWRRRNSGSGWFGTTLPKSTANKIDARLVIGSAIFGVGWGLGGFCPGPVLADLGALRPEALVFVPAMAVGMLIARRGFGADRS